MTLCRDPKIRPDESPAVGNTSGSRLLITQGLISSDRWRGGLNRCMPLWNAATITVQCALVMAFNTPPAALLDRAASAKILRGKLAGTVIDKANKQAVRAAYKPTLQKQIKESAFMQKRSAGVPRTQVPEEEQWELVNLIWDAPAEQTTTVGPAMDYGWQGPAEIIRFAVCRGCGELVAELCLRIEEGQPLCMDCAGNAGQIKQEV